MQRNRRPQTQIQAFVLCLGGLLALLAAPLAAQSHHFVYLSATSQTSATTQTISGFEVNPVSGSLTAVAGSPFNEGRDPGGLAFHPSGRFLYAVNPNDKSVSAFAVNAVTGVLTELPASPFAVGGGSATPKFVAVEPAGKFLYVVSTLANPSATLISYYSIDSAGALNTAPEGATSLGSFLPVGLVFKPGDHFLYLVGTAGTNNVSIFTLELDPGSGTLSGIHFFAGPGQFAKSVAVAPQGQFLFVGRGQSLGAIDTYALPANGIFDPPLNTFSIAGSSGLPFALAAGVSGSYLFAAVANQGLVGFSIDPGAGALTALPGPPSVAPPISPSTLLVTDPVTQFPYLYSEQRAFSISPAGALNPLPDSPLAVAGGVTGIAAASPLDAVAPDPVNPISGPVTSLSPPALLFPEQFVGSGSAPRLVSLSNTGAAPLSVTGISLTNTSDFTLAHNCLAVLTVLPPNNACTITITFQPSFDGQRQATLSVVDNAPGSPHAVSLAGAGVLPFTIEPDSPPNASVTAGQMAQYNLRLVPAPGFNGRVLLSCSGAPDQAACDVPPLLDLNGVAAAPFSVMVPTKARSTLVLPTRRSYPDLGNDGSRRILAWGTMMTLLLLLLSGLRTAPTAASKTMRKAHCGVMPLLLCVSLGLVSCSGATSTGASSSTATASTGTSSTSPSAAPAPSPATGTPAGQYTLTLTAAFGNASQVRQLSLSIQ